MKRISGFFCFFSGGNTGTKKEQVHFCVHGTDQKGLQAVSSPSANPWPSSTEREAGTGQQTAHVGAVGLMPQTPATMLTLHVLCLGANATS